MNPALLALASAACWGTSDFLGGMAARRISPALAVAIAHALSLLGLVGILAVDRPPAPDHASLLLGLGAGFLGGGGLMLFYAALSRGAMGATAALAGVLTAAVPMLYGMLTQGLPKRHQLFGFALAVAAIWLIASAPKSPAGDARESHVWPGFVAGLCFGVYFVLLKLASQPTLSSRGVGVGENHILWAMTASRVTSTSLASAVWVFFTISRKSAAPVSRLSWQALALSAAVGMLDTCGNLLYLLASRLGRIDVAAVLSSLYPAGTILLAVWLLKERTTRTQTAGIALAVGAVMLIAG